LATSVGTFSGQPSAFGGSWYYSAIDFTDDPANVSLYLGYFGLTPRTDGKYNLLAIGAPNGSNVLSSTVPSFLMGDVLFSDSSSSREILGWTTGYLQQHDAQTGIKAPMEGYMAALYHRDINGTIETGLLRGPYEGITYGMGDTEMFRITSESGIDRVTKDPLTEGDHVQILAGEGVGNYARLSGAFGGTGTIVGGGDLLRTWLIVYELNGQEQLKPYGVYSLDISYDLALAHDTKPTYTQKPDTSSTSFTANLGGTLPFGYVTGNPEEGYWMAKLSGTWDAAGTGAGTIKSDMSGRYLAPNQWGRMVGGFYGVYNGSASGTWGGNAVGTFAGAPLAMSADFSGHLETTLPGTIVSRTYERPYYESYTQHFSPLEYEVHYFVPQGGSANARRTLSFESAEWNTAVSDEVTYFPSGNWVNLEKGNGVTHPIGSDVTLVGTDLTTDPPQAILSNGLAFVTNYNPGVTSFTESNYVSTNTSEWTNTNGLLVGDRFTGRLGVLPGQSLWTSSPDAKAGLIMMGTHGSYQGDQLFVTSGSGTDGRGQSPLTFSELLNRRLMRQPILSRDLSLAYMRILITR